MLSRFLGAALSALAFVFLLTITACSPMPALAADAGATSVAIPIGDIVNEAATAALPLLAALIAWAFRRLPANVVAVLKTIRADQLLEHAVAYGLNAVAGAEKGKVLSVDVGNQVLAEAARYTVNHGAPGVVQWLGGPTAIAEKVVARLNLGADAAVGTSFSAGSGGVAIVQALNRGLGALVGAPQAPTANPAYAPPPTTAPPPGGVL